MRKKGIWVVVSVLVVLGLLLGGFGCKAPPTEAPPPAAPPPAEAPPPAAAPPTEAPPAEEVAPLPPVKIGFIYWMTGPAKVLGDRCNWGFKVAVKEINDAGGILGGRMIESTDYDMGYSADALSAAVKKAVNDEMDVLIGGLESGLGLLLTQLGKEYGIPVVIAGSADEQINKGGYPGFIHYFPNTKPCYNPIFDWMETQASTLVELHFETGWGRVASGVMHERWDRPGSPIRILDTIWLPPTQADLSVEMTRAVAQNPDFIFTLTWGPAQISAFSTAKELGYEGGLMPSRCTLLPEAVAAFPEVFEGVYDGQDYFPDPNVPENWAYVKAVREMWGADVMPLTVSVINYESVYIAMLAMDKAGTTSDLNKLYRAYLALEWMTPRGEPLKILPDGQVVLSKMNIVQAQGGKLVAVQRGIPYREEDYRWWDEDPESIWWED